MSLSPKSVLDVGCGQGVLMEELAGRGVTCAGLEPAEEAVAACRARGLDVCSGRAELLPFETAGFDVVVTENTAHHIEFLDRALLEAARVARRAVLIMDGWFDKSFASQRVARAFELWVKRLDRRSGMVHDPCSDPARLAQPFIALGLAVDVSTRLDLAPQPVEEMLQIAHRYAPSMNADDQTQLEQIMDNARLYGATRPGIFLLCARK